MPRKESLSAILETLRRQFPLFAVRKADLTMKGSFIPATEQRLKNLQGSLKGSGALKALVDERQKELG